MKTASIAAQSTTGRYALIKLGSVNLVLLQDGIRTLESTADVTTEDPPANGVGWIKFQQRPWPVYCLNEDFGTVHTLPESHRICALLNIQNGFIGLVCNEIVLLRDNELRPQSIPVCMAPEHSPITALVHFNDSLACLTSSQLLACFLENHGPAGSHAEAGVNKNV